MSPALAIVVPAFNEEEAIDAATHHVHMEYYIWEPDWVGTRFRDLLTEAAKRGVEVRILYDSVGSPHLDKGFWKPLCAAGGLVGPAGGCASTAANATRHCHC